MIFGIDLMKNYVSARKTTGAITAMAPRFANRPYKASFYRGSLHIHIVPVEA